MGQLKSGIEGLRKVLQQTELEVEKVEELSTKHTDRIEGLGTKASEGYDVLYLYLVEKFKKSNTTPAAEATKTLKSIMDPGIQQSVQGIQQWKGDLKQAIGVMNNAMTVAKGGLLKTLQTAESQGMQLGQLAMKKQSKLLKSPKYKDKIKSYLVSLNEIIKTIKQQRELVSKSLSLTDNWVESSYPISPDMTVAQIEKLASASAIHQLKEFEQNKTQLKQQVRKWRESTKGMPGQLAVMKKWVDEADGMELESK